MTYRCKWCTGRLVHGQATNPCARCESTTYDRIRWKFGGTTISYTINMATLYCMNMQPTANLASKFIRRICRHKKIVLEIGQMNLTIEECIKALLGLANMEESK